MSPTPPRAPRLRLQLTLVFGLLVAVASVAVALGLGAQMRERARADAGRALNLIAANASRQLDAGLLNNLVSAEAIASWEQLWEHGLDAPSVRQAMARSQAVRPDNLWIGAADLEGRVHSATGGLLVGQNVAQRPWLIAGREGSHVGDVHPAKLLATLVAPDRYGEPQRFLDYAAPIRVAGRTVGVFGVHSSWEWVGDTLDTVLPPAARQGGMELFVFDRTGRLLYAPGGDSPVPPWPLPAVPVGTGEARAVVWPDGQEALTAAQTLHPVRGGLLGWTIVARQPLATAHAGVGEATGTALAVGGVVAALAMLVAGLAARRFGSELAGIAQAARDVQAGVPGAAIPQARSSAELQTLSASLDAMTRRLVDSRQALEQQVQERTAALEAANAELGRQALTDPLTGLMNRRGFDPLLERALADARRNHRVVSVAVFDADHFKRVNDEHGHAVGDEVLQLIARTLRERLRDTDAVARMGGEEFAVLLPDTGLADAAGAAQALIDRVAETPHPVAGRITLSAGVAVCADGLTPAQDLVQRADAALYQAKAAGRNRVALDERAALSL